VVLPFFIAFSPLHLVRVVKANCWVNNDFLLTDTFMLTAGRYADTEKLGLDAVGVKVNPKTGKVRIDLLYKCYCRCYLD
jgi:pyruvate/2-oxoglutarate dehydrogenase complex dihydrolipoamide dehydrogenase (E3) component